jgi:hypothetical protein
MARVVFVWEQGTALGHLSSLRLPMQVAQDLGHEVILVARELHRIPEVLAGLRFGLMQAPFKQNVAHVDQSQIRSFTHLIAQQCFSSAQELLLYLRAWRSIFDLLQPAMVCFEHSPTALVAAWPYGFSKVLAGEGFAIPQFNLVHGVLQPFPTTVLNPAEVQTLRADDRRLLASINQALTAMGDAPMPDLGALYGQAPQHLLMTLPAIDPFGPRPGAFYLGVDKPTVPRKLQWPTGAGPKVFGYLQNFPGLQALLQALQEGPVRAIIFGPEIPAKVRQLFANEQIVVTDEMADLAAVSLEADWVLHHGNHGTAAAFLQDGMPQLLIPRHQEQLFGALRLVEQQAALMVFQDQSDYRAAVAAMGRRQDIREGAKVAQADCPTCSTETKVKFMKHLFTQIA